ncbi:RNA-binding protein FUS-like [Pollicipes pollicipes]|uniref:RNA-binding protein FUS-like n=1 Tax=Pollicipes pollicipes TaxID=41117 RepID=UPI001884EDEE|nr:RNA-binding protein FUS-like [Pollicipes pollicipes]
MSGYGAGNDRFQGPASNNQPLEFGNRMGGGGSPDSGDRRGSRARGGSRGGRPGIGRSYQDNGGPDAGGDFNGRRNDVSGSRRDRGRRDGSHNSGIQMGGMVPPGGV